MNIAIIEDLQLDYETLRDALAECLKGQKADFELHWFQTGEAFLADINVDTEDAAKASNATGSADATYTADAFKAADKYDLLFFDMLLGEGMNGIDAARALRKTGSRAPIVFTTSERDYALEGYEVQAIDYLLKPYKAERVSAVCNRVLSAMQTRRFITLQVGRTTQCICTDDVQWAETMDHYMDIHISGEETVHATISFDELVKSLPPTPQFQCCYRGIIVNMAHVDVLKGSEFLLKDEQKVPVSRLKKAEMQKALSDYAIFKTREEMGL